MPSSRFLCSLSTLVSAVLCLTAQMPAQQGAHFAQMDGESAGDTFGTTLTIITDTFAAPDGRPDVVVGAPGNDWGGTDSGRLYWYSLASGSPALLDQLFGGSGQGWGNLWLDTLPDWDLDGFEEIWVNYSGSGRVLTGQKAVYANFHYYEDHGFPIGDFDGDGIRDLAVFHDYPASSSPGYLRVYSGADLVTLLLSLSGIDTGNGNDSDIGYRTTTANDLNADGFDDIVTTEPLANNQWIADCGALRALAGALPGFGGTAIWTFFGEKNNDQLEDVINVGDWDGDSVSDFAVGSPGVDIGALTGAGRIYLVSGATGLEFGRLDGFASNLRMGEGRRLAVSDLTGDGQVELIVGLPAFDANQLTDAGAVRVYEWTGSGLSLLQGIDGDSAGDKFGSAVHAAGDLNGDGINDFVVSSPFADPAGFADAGSVFAFSGFTPGGPVLTGPASAQEGEVVPFDLGNGSPGHIAVLLVSPSSLGSSLFGHSFEVGKPVYVGAVGGLIPLNGTLRMWFEVPDPFPANLPFTLYFEAMLFDPWGAPFDTVYSSNLVAVSIL